MAEKNYACVKDGIVINVIVCDDPSEELLNLFKETFKYDEILPETETSVIGSTYDGLNFYLPPQQVPIFNQEDSI